MLSSGPWCNTVSSLSHFTHLLNSWKHASITETHSLIRLAQHTTSDPVGAPPPPYLRPDVQTTLSEFRQRGQLLNKCPGLDRRRHKMDYINPRGRKKPLPLSRLLLSSCCRTLPSRKVFGKFSRSFLFIWFFPFCRISFLPPLFFLQILKDSIWKVVGRQ